MGCNALQDAKMLQKQCNLRTSVKVAQKVFFSKDGDNLLEELLCISEKGLLYIYI